MLAESSTSLARALGALSAARARVLLRAVDRLGARPRVFGRPWVQNLGRIEIGDDFVLLAGLSRAHFANERGALLRIGDGVTVAGGAAFGVAASLSIGDRTTVGRNVMFIDSDYHSVEDRNLPGAKAPIVVGAAVRIGDDAIVLKGATIGDRAWIAPGAVVSGEVAAGASVGAATERTPLAPVVADGDLGERVRRVVEAAIAAGPLRFDDHLVRGGECDSLTVLRLCVELEGAFGVALEPEAVAGAPDLDAVVRLVEHRLLVGGRR